MTTTDQYGAISATVIKDSVHADTRLITLEVNVPRLIVAQINTHRMIVKNYQSSRAVPTTALLADELIFVPQRVGVNKAGMGADTYLEGEQLAAFQADWLALRAMTVEAVQGLRDKYNLAKELANRPLEPYMFTRGVLTGTLASWQHVLKLRKDSAAQPEFQELAQCIEAAISASTPQVLQLGEYHLPYVDAVDAGADDSNIKLSASRIAMVSYRKCDMSLEKAHSVFEKLGIFSDKRHISPLQHVACAQDALQVADEVYDVYLNSGAHYYAEFGDAFVQVAKYVENLCRLTLGAGAVAQNI